MTDTDTSVQKKHLDDDYVPLYGFDYGWIPRNYWEPRPDFDAGMVMIEEIDKERNERSRARVTQRIG